MYILNSQGWFGRQSSIGEEFALHADICNLRLGSGFLAIDQNMRPNRFSHIHIQKSSMNTVIFANATIGFSENLFLVKCAVAPISKFNNFGHRHDTDF